MLRRTCTGVRGLSWPGTALSASTGQKHLSYLLTKHPKRVANVAKRGSMAACAAEHNAAADQQELMELLADAHAHPQLDPANMQRVSQLQCSHVAAMSVSYDVDWDIMLQLHQLAGAGIAAACMTLLLLHSPWRCGACRRERRTPHVVVCSSGQHCMHVRAQTCMV